MGLFLEWAQIKESSLPENPQQQEEFLRDVIAIIRGQESPEFYPNQNAVNSYVQWLISSFIDPNDSKSKRKLINKLEEQWRKAKELASSYLK